MTTKYSNILSSWDDSTEMRTGWGGGVGCSSCCFSSRKASQHKGSLHLSPFPCSCRFLEGLHPRILESLLPRSLLSSANSRAFNRRTGPAGRGEKKHSPPAPLLPQRGEVGTESGCGGALLQQPLLQVIQTSIG